MSAIGNQKPAAVIHYIDAGEFYSVYGISTLIVLILLMWYFVRSNLESGCSAHSANHHSSVRSTKEGLGGIPIEDPDIMKFMPEFNGTFEYEPIQITPEGEEPSYKFWAGTYGDVPLNIYDVKDIAYKPEWDHNTAIYVPNMRTIYRQTYTPIEASFW